MDPAAALTATPITELVHAPPDATPLVSPGGPLSDSLAEETEESSGGEDEYIDVGDMSDELSGPDEEGLAAWGTAPDMAPPQLQLPPGPPPPLPMSSTTGNQPLEGYHNGVSGGATPEFPGAATTPDARTPTGVNDKVAPRSGIGTSDAGVLTRVGANYSDEHGEHEDNFDVGFPDPKQTRAPVDALKSASNRGLGSARSNFDVDSASFATPPNTAAVAEPSHRELDEIERDGLGAATAANAEALGLGVGAGLGGARIGTKTLDPIEGLLMGVEEEEKEMIEVLPGGLLTGEEEEEEEEEMIEVVNVQPTFGTDALEPGESFAATARGPGTSEVGVLGRELETVARDGQGLEAQELRELDISAPNNWCHIDVDASGCASSGSAAVVDVQDLGTLHRKLHKDTTLDIESRETALAILSQAQGLQKRYRAVAASYTSDPDIDEDNAELKRLLAMVEEEVVDSIGELKTTHHLRAKQVRLHKVALDRVYEVYYVSNMTAAAEEECTRLETSLANIQSWYKRAGFSGDALATLAGAAPSAIGGAPLKLCRQLAAQGEPTMQAAVGAMLLCNRDAEAIEKRLTEYDDHRVELSAGLGTTVRYGDAAASPIAYSSLGEAMIKDYGDFEDIFHRAREEDATSSCVLDRLSAIPEVKHLRLEGARSQTVAELMRDTASRDGAPPQDSPVYIVYIRLVAARSSITLLLILQQLTTSSNLDVTVTLGSLKTERRIAFKSVHKYSGNFSKCHDIARATIAANNLEDVVRACEAVAASPHLAITRIKNRFAEGYDALPDGGYRDVQLLCVLVCNGRLRWAEVQINLIDMLVKKKERTPRYTLGRTIGAFSPLMAEHLGPLTLTAIDRLRNGFLLRLNLDSQREMRVTTQVSVSSDSVRENIKAFKLNAARGEWFVSNSSKLKGAVEAGQLNQHAVVSHIDGRETASLDVCSFRELLPKAARKAASDATKLCTLTVIDDLWDALVNALKDGVSSNRLRSLSLACTGLQLDDNLAELVPRSHNEESMQRQSAVACLGSDECFEAPQWGELMRWLQSGDGAGRRQAYALLENASCNVGGIPYKVTPAFAKKVASLNPRAIAEGRNTRGTRLKRIMKAVTNAKHLRSLDLSRNHLGADGFKIVCKDLGKLGGLRTFKASSNRARAEEDSIKSARILAGTLPKLTHLRVLHLGSNRFRAEGIKLLVPALKRLELLEDLCLHSVSLYPEGCAILAPALERLRGLRKLSLYGNKIGDAGLQSLIPALRTLLLLASLDLKTSGITSAGVRMLTAVFEKPVGGGEARTLKTLNLWKNEILSSSKVAHGLCSALARWGNRQSPEDVFDRDTTGKDYCAGGKAKAKNDAAAEKARAEGLAAAAESNAHEIGGPLAPSASPRQVVLQEGVRAGGGTATGHLVNKLRLARRAPTTVPARTGSFSGRHNPHVHISSRDPETLFVLIEQIGSGFYGAVHKAKIKKTGKLAAVKMIQMEDGEEFADIENEIAILDQCNHENIVAYYGSFMKHKTMWICMEFCGGGSVSDMSYGLLHGLKEPEIANIMFYSLKGLDYLHHQHKVHRDIKGGNILLNDNGAVKLANLGVSAQLTSTLAKRKSFIGSPYWIAPEIIAVEMKMGPDGYSSLCDIWSLGITAIELAETAPPMFDLHPMRALYLIPKNRPPTLANKKSWTKDFHDWLKQSLLKNPDKRPDAATLTRHNWFKHVASRDANALADLVRRFKAVGGGGGGGEEENWEVEDPGGGTVTRQQPSGLSRVASVQGGRAQGAGGPDLAVQQLEADTGVPRSGASGLITCGWSGGQWGNNVDVDDGNYARYVKEGEGQAKYMHDASPQRLGSEPGAAEQSFVLFNVFAGCPLTVNCAASWKCHPPDGEPCLYIIVGAMTGLYILETSGDKRELVQVSKRVCTWLYVMDDEGMMISVSGVGLVCVHDLNSLLVGPTEHIKFKTTKLIEGAKGGMCAVTKTPDTGFTYLCAAVTRNLVLMQWWAPRKKFMKLKDFETPFDDPPSMMELLVLESEALPVLCVGCTRDRKTRGKTMAIVNPNFPPEKVAKHMSAELGWVRVRAGREDCFATAVRQIGPDRFMVCFSNVATFLTSDGRVDVPHGYPEKIVFETPPVTAVYTPEAVIAFSEHRMERRSIRSGKITHQMKHNGETFRVVGREGNIIIETRTGSEPTSHLYLLVRR